MTGWICPRCGRVHAPWVPSCDCSRVPAYVPVEPTDASKLPVGWWEYSGGGITVTF